MMRESSWLISAWKANVSVSEAMTRPFPNATREEEAAARGRRRVGFVGSARERGMRWGRIVGCGTVGDFIGRGERRASRMFYQGREVGLSARGERVD